MFGNEFKSIDKLFGDAKVRDWDIDEFYVAILSLTGARVTPKRMVLYPHAVKIAGIDLNRALVWRNMIRDCRITESRKALFDETEVEKVFYIIRGKILPYIENNIFYGVLMVIMIGLVMEEVIVGALQGMYTGIYGGNVLQTEPGQKMI